jgi:hypothetical protein
MLSSYKLASSLFKTTTPLYATALKLASDLIDVNKLTISALALAFTLISALTLAVITQISAISSDLIIRLNYRQTS